MAKQTPTAARPAAPTSFRDAAGRLWSISLTHGRIMRLREALGVDVYTMFADGMSGVGELLSDMYKVVDVVCFLSRSVQDKPPESMEDFCDALTGEVIEQATDCLIQATIDFFPERREALMKIREKGTAVAMKVRANGMAKLEAIDLDKIAEQVEKQMAKGPSIGSNSSTDLPASSALIPDPSPSAR